MADLTWDRDPMGRQNEDATHGVALPGGSLNTARAVFGERLDELVDAMNRELVA